MISFIINVYKLLVAVFNGIKKDQEFRILLFLLVTLMTGSVIFYCKMEGWSIVDALYFSVMTMATIGYGDFVPTHTISKIFTIIFTFLSIGIFAAVITKIVAISVDRRKERLAKKHQAK